MGRLLTRKRTIAAFVIIVGYMIYSLTFAQQGQQANDLEDSLNSVQDSSIGAITHDEETATHDSDEAGHGTEEEATGHGSSEVADVLLGLIIILLAAKLGGDIFERFKQPAVLGELVLGMIIGNLVLLGVDFFEPFKHSVTLEVLAEIGVILLLFSVGLESSLDEMMKVGAASFMVATFGVVAPFFLGWGVAILFLPEHSPYVHIFIGATLTAT